MECEFTARQAAADVLVTDEGGVSQPAASSSRALRSRPGVTWRWVTRALLALPLLGLIALLAAASLYSPAPPATGDQLVDERRCSGCRRACTLPAPDTPPASSRNGQCG